MKSFKKAAVAAATTAFLFFPFLSSAAPTSLSKRASGACSGDCSGVHDPNVVISADGTYYRFQTFNEITISTAPSISGPWTTQGPALPGGSSIDLPGNTDLWAPDVSNIDGTYYLYYAVSTGGSQNSGIGVATSTTMDSGSWTDHGSIGIPQNSDWNLIDPNLLIVNFGDSLQMSFGSYWDDIYQVPMASPPLTLASGASPVHLEQNSTARPDGLPVGPSEGSYQFWWTVGSTNYYYLFFSSGACCNTPPNLVPAGEEYKVMVCRSESPTGGFVDQNGVDCAAGGGTPVLESNGDVYAPGGQGVIYDKGQGAVVMYYHYVNPSIGYGQDDFQFGWNTLDFSSGWPVVS
ncbi:hypothetical protein MMC10_004561 [Thelotrema lepadinum]|nr:hypothetical protein [Thelotrema lepadinum]